MELRAKIQEVQNEVNCMNDSRDFKDAESVRGDATRACRLLHEDDYSHQGLDRRSLRIGTGRRHDSATLKEKQDLKLNKRDAPKQVPTTSAQHGAALALLRRGGGHREI